MNTDIPVTNYGYLSTIPALLDARKELFPKLKIPITRIKILHGMITKILSRTVPLIRAEKFCKTHGQAFTVPYDIKNFKKNPLKSWIRIRP
jgi:hypothetical protein